MDCGRRYQRHDNRDPVRSMSVHEVVIAVCRWEWIRVDAGRVLRGLARWPGALPGGGRGDLLNRPCRSESHQEPGRVPQAQGVRLRLASRSVREDRCARGLVVRLAAGSPRAPGSRKSRILLPGCGCTISSCGTGVRSTPWSTAGSQPPTRAPGRHDLSSACDGVWRLSAAVRRVQVRCAGGWQQVRSGRGGGGPGCCWSAPGREDGLGGDAEVHGEVGLDVAVQLAAPVWPRSWRCWCRTWRCRYGRPSGPACGPRAGRNRPPRC